MISRSGGFQPPKGDETNNGGWKPPLRVELVNQMSCPDKRTLELLLESEAANDAALQVHLDACADCRHTLEMLARDPGTWAGATHSQAFREEPALQELMERLKAAETPLADNEIQALLDPCDKPGVLGKIHEYEIIEEIGSGAMSIVFK